MSGWGGDGTRVGRTAKQAGSPLTSAFRTMRGVIFGALAYGVLLALELVLRIADRKPAADPHAKADEVAAR
jgi:hypothetical protein